jgi:hypothetical protein
MNVMTDARPATRRKNPAATLMQLRKLHAYFGMLIAPATIFMAATGLAQIYSFHESHDGYTPPPLIEKLGVLHKKQLFAPARKGPPGGQARKPAADGAAPGTAEKAPVSEKAQVAGKTPVAEKAAVAEKAQAPQGAPKAGAGANARKTKLSTVLLKAFFAIAALGLIFSTVTGVWIALSQPLRRKVYLALLAIGTVVPVVLAAFSN